MHWASRGRARPESDAPGHGPGGKCTSMETRRRTHQVYEQGGGHVGLEVVMPLEVNTPVREPGGGIIGMQTRKHIRGAGGRPVHLEIDAPENGQGGG